MLIVWGISLIFAFPLVISSKNALPHSIACNVLYFCGGVFEQLARYTARYTMRYQESDLHLGLYSSYSSYNFCLLYFFLSSTNFSTSTLLTSSSIVAVLIAKAGHVWVSGPEEFLLYILSLTLQQVCYC